MEAENKKIPFYKSRTLAYSLLALAGFSLVMFTPIVPVLIFLSPLLVFGILIYIMLVNK